MSLPDKVAVLSDVHGNIPALEAVLADIRSRGIDRICNLGDIVGKGGNSDVAIDMCREYCTVNVMGNWDQLVCDLADKRPWPAFAREQIGSERMAWLGNLPYAYDFWLSGMPVRLFHASQDSLNHRVYPWHTYETQLEMFDNSEATGFDHPTPRIVAYGDIHTVFLHTLRPGRTLLNVGSTGNSLDLPMATYALLVGTVDSRTPSPFSIEIVRLEYDRERAIQDAYDAGAPNADHWATELRTAVYRGAASS